MLCRDLTLSRTVPQGVEAHALRCRSWSCDLCRPDRRRALIAKAAGGKPNTLITLTANPGVGTGPLDRARALARSWGILRRRAMRRYGYKRLPALVVFEATQRGEPHLHILARVKWIDQRWIADQMRALTNSPVVDIRRCTSANSAARYVAKYVGKAPHRFGTLKRYWATPDWEKWRRDRTRPVVAGAGKWSVRPWALWEYARRCAQTGRVIRWLTDESFLAVYERPPARAGP